MSEVYDVDALLNGLNSIEENIRALEEALQKEREKKAEYEAHLAKARAVLKLHKVGDDGRPN